MLTICWCIVAISALALDIILHLRRGSSFETHPAFVLWVPLGLALIAVAMLCILVFIKRARAYSASMLTLGTCLMTCYLVYMMDQIATMTTTFMTTSWPDLPPINSSTPIDNFAQTPQELTGAWLFAIGLLVNTLQCSFACRMGLFPSTVCTVVYVLVCTVGQALSANTYGSPFYRVSFLVATVFITIILTVQSSKIEHQRQVLHETQQRALAYQRVAQKADGVLNHILKNNVVDAQTCIELFFDGHSQDVLEQACDLLFRSMWWCRLREAVLRIVEGSYKKAVRNVSLHQFCHDLLVGRPGITLDCPSMTVLLDPIACNIVLDNAITNAFRHGCTENQELRLKVEVSNHDSQTSTAVSFTLINRAKADKPPFNSWSASDTEAAHASANVDHYESVSTGLGLQHIAMAVSVCDMSAELWQEDAYVHFRLCMDSEVSCSIDVEHDSTASIAVAPHFPPNVHVLCMDDSPIARRALESILPKEIPGSVVEVFGETLADVAKFKRAVAEQCDIAIVDQNLSFPGVEIKGTDLIKEILAAGYGGLACVRSANCTDADQREYLESGAHCAIDKDARWPEMVQLLARAYANRMPRPSAGTPVMSVRTSVECDACISSQGNLPGLVDV